MTTMQRASVLFGASFLANAAFGYLFHFVLGWHLTVAEFGLVTFLEAVLALCGLALVNGYPPLVTRLLAHAREDGRGSILRATLTYNVLLATLLAGAVAAAWWIGILDVGPDAGLLVGLVCGTLVLTSAGAVLKGALQGQFRFERASGVLVLEQAVKLVAGSALVLAGFRVLGGILAIALGVAVGVVLGALALPRLRGWSAKAPPGIAAMGLPMFMGVVSTSLLMTFDVPALKLLLPAGEADVAVGLYGAAALLARFPAFLVGAMVTALFPFLARAGRDHAAARAVTGRAIRYVIVGVLPVSLFLALAPDASLRLLFPPQYAEGARVLSYLSMAMFLLAVATVYATLYQAASSPLVPAVALIGASLAQVALMVALVPRMGAEGAALSSLLACGLGLALLVLRFARDHGLPRFGGDALRVIAALAAPVALLVLVEPGSRIGTVALSGAVLLAHVGGLLATRFLTLREVRTTVALVWTPAPEAEGS